MPPNEGASLNQIPHDLETEQAYLGAMIQDKEARELGIDLVTPAVFFSDANKVIFKALVAMTKKNLAVDNITLAEFLKRHKKTGSSGGQGYITLLIGMSPMPWNLEQRADALNELWRLRKIRKMSVQMAEAVGDRKHDSLQIIDRLESKLTELSTYGVQESCRESKDVCASIYSAIESGNPGGDVPTNYNRLDNLFNGGFANGDMIILAGRPGVGKTAFALNIFKRAAEAKYSGIYFIMEMNAELLIERLLADESCIPLSMIRAKKDLEGWHTRKILEAMGTISNLPLNIVDEGSLNLPMLKSATRLMKRKKGLDFIIVDYLQKLYSGHSLRTFGSRDQEVSYMSRELKALARELNVPVLCLAQLNREIEKRNDKRPRLSDLRESGSIEQDADVVMMLYSESYHEEIGSEKKVMPAKQDNGDEIEAIVRKNRNGATGTARLKFYKTMQRFSEVW